LITLQQSNHSKNSLIIQLLCSRRQTSDALSAILSAFAIRDPNCIARFGSVAPFARPSRAAVNRNKNLSPTPRGSVRFACQQKRSNSIVNDSYIAFSFYRKNLHRYFPLIRPSSSISHNCHYFRSNVRFPGESALASSHSASSNISSGAKTVRTSGRLFTGHMPFLSLNQQR